MFYILNHTLQSIEDKIIKRFQESMEPPPDIYEWVRKYAEKYNTDLEKRVFMGQEVIDLKLDLSKTYDSVNITYIPIIPMRGMSPFWGFDPSQLPKPKKDVFFYCPDGHHQVEQTDDLVAAKNMPRDEVDSVKVQLSCGCNVSFGRIRDRIKLDC